MASHDSFFTFFSGNSKVKEKKVVVKAKCPN